MPTTPERKQAEKRGRLAEMITAWRYRLSGYRLIASRYRCAYGEIDLIMRRGRTVVFIEVKYAGRQDGFSFDKTLPAAKQQARIIAAAEHFLMQSRPDSAARIDQTRIDVVLVRPPLMIKVFANAIQQ